MLAGLDHDTPPIGHADAADQVIWQTRVTNNILSFGFGSTLRTDCLGAYLLWIHFSKLFRLRLKSVLCDLAHLVHLDHICLFFSIHYLTI